MRSRIVMKNNEEIKILLTFLKKTSEGEYAPIEETSIPYSRIKETTEVLDDYEITYFYGIIG